MSEMVASDSIKKVNFVCPICKSKKDVDVPESIINQNTQLTTISIAKDLVCSHHFQAFVDKQFRVRGYQKVDFELADQKRKNVTNDDKELFNNLVVEGNFLEYPKKSGKSIENVEKDVDLSIEKKEMTLEEIYEEFWEFIDDDNSEFQELIIKDIRRKREKDKEIYF